MLVTTLCQYITSISFSEVVKVWNTTMVAAMDVGKKMRLTEPEQFHAMVKMHLRCFQWNVYFNGWLFGCRCSLDVERRKVSLLDGKPGPF